jgi:flavin reductase (DIM6/NTAB) family NADH-FMN oxidoreductase RutF
MPETAKDHSNLATGFRLAMRRLASGVGIVVAMEDTGPIGMAASSITSLTMDPPAVLVCINQSAGIHHSLAPGKDIGVSLLSAHQQDISAAFGGALPRERRFEAGRWSLDEGGIPRLDEAQANLTCRIETMTSYGTHSIVVARVMAVTIGEPSAPLIYHEGAYI